MIPQRGSETFISAIGHLDGRIDLYKNDLIAEGKDDPFFGERGLQLQIENRALMDLSIMASKLAYENANVVRNVVNQHWKACFSVCASLSVSSLVLVCLFTFFF